MHKNVAPSDAVAALRSFPRRYREHLAGPKGDDTWERLARTKAPGQTRSGLGWAVHVTQMMRSLAEALAALPTSAHPAVQLAVLEKRDSEPKVDTTVKAVLDELEKTAKAAADAAAARHGDDWSRAITVDGADVEAGDVLSRVVLEVAAHLRDVEGAVEAARTRPR